MTPVNRKAGTGERTREPPGETPGQHQSLLLLEKLNELDLDVEADLCEKLHDDAEHLFRTLSSRLDELQDDN